MRNWGNTLDRWYHRGAIIVWPRARAFANRAETSPGWALDEIVSIASSGDAAGSRGAAATVEPVWSGLGRRNSGPPLGKALRAADAAADENLTAHETEALGPVAVRYRQDWTVDLLRGWFGEDRLAWDWATGQAEWVTRWLPGICTGLHGGGRSGAARQLLDLAWDQIGGMPIRGSRRHHPVTGTGSSASWASRSPRC